MQRALIGDGCWKWTGTVAGVPGYGRIIVGDTRIYAHRWAYEQFIGLIPEELDLDHLCRNRLCVRPDHLEPVTRQVNLLRGITIPAANAAKTHCPQNHEYTPENTRVSKRNQRSCKTCARIRHQQYRKEI